jgi:hypothetical protein
MYFNYLIKSAKIEMKDPEIRFILIIVLVLSIGQLNAQIVTDRPDQTESSSTVGRGNLQIEAGFGVGFEEDGGISTRYIYAPSTLFRYGITRGIEIRVLSQFATMKIQDQHVQGITDMEIGTKIQVLQKEDVNTEIAYITHLLVPTGTIELTDGHYGTINKLAVSHQLSETMSLGYNVGYNYLGNGKGDMTYSIVLGVGINEKTGFYVEPFGEITDLEDFILNFDAGIAFLAKENLQFDFSFGTGINQRMNYISLGCCWKIERGGSYP